MKETRFIAQNKEKWHEAETLLESNIKDPDKLSNLFIQVVDDLSYSRTYYPNRSVRVYLNKIARQFFSIIYGHKKEKHNHFKLFWLDELPQLIVYSRRELFVSFVFFLIALCIGVISSYNDPQFVSTILGDSYVSMTDENIKKGDPMAVYKQSHQIEMFLGITFNNLMVAFRTYVLGIFLGLGTLASLLYNGIMVGSFQYYFIDRGLFIESALTIWLHGTLEISSIILAGGAGLTLASGLIFPGTYSRIQSLQLSGIRSLKLMLAITPVFILAAVIESFLTRYTEAPVILKLFLILLSAVFIIGYYVIYPWLKWKKGFDIPLKQISLPPSNLEPVNFIRIKNNAELIKDTFQFYSRHYGSISTVIFWVALGTSVPSLFLEEESFITIETEWWISLLSDMLYALGTPTPLSILINSLGASIIIYRVMKIIDTESKKSKSKLDKKSFLQIFIIAVIIYGMLYLGPWGILLLIASFGILIFTAFVQLTEKANLAYAMSHGLALFKCNNTQGFSLQFALLLLLVSFLLVVTAPLAYMHLSVLKWNFVATDTWSQNFIHLIEIFFKVFAFYSVLPILVAGLSYLYFSQEEVATARHLRESIAKMGQRTTKSRTS